MNIPEKRFDVAVVGSGMSGLSAAALLAQKGLKVAVIEQNWQPGGCTSSYWRKGFVFESGATTLVGLDEGMPFHYLLQQLGIDIPVRKLDLPMRVVLRDGTLINRYENLDEWIAEATRVFGPTGQREFWQYCFKVSRFVWDASLRYRSFPPASFSDLLSVASNVRLSDLRFARLSYLSVARLLSRFGLQDNPRFVEFVNEQLMITAQNKMEEVNALFGAASLCYTNYGNYYVDGGMLGLVTPLVDYIKAKDGELLLRTPVNRIEREGAHYLIRSPKAIIRANFLIAAIPANNLERLFPEVQKRQKLPRIFNSPQLNSAFQMGIGFRPHLQHLSLHHQIHLAKPLAGIGSKSIFVSFSHPSDSSRSDQPGMAVASISTHIADPARSLFDLGAAEAEILSVLEERNLILPENIVYKHSSGPESWEKWTGREWGFVGGYPQYLSVKPWQMNEARIDGYKAYICGDSTYPGQGIPGTVLSGIIATEKLSRDWLG